MDFIIIFLWIIILIILYFIFNKLFKIFIPKPIILYLLSTFKQGNFILIDSNSNQILKIINDTKQFVPIIKVNNQEKFYLNIYEKGELGLGESYMNKDWNTDNLVEFLNVICLNRTNKNIPKISLEDIYSLSQNYDKSNIKHHYDVGNDFYLQFLKDDLNAYSCGFWFNENDTLNSAQYNKVNTIIKKLQAKPGSTILDIGCGWGKIANYVSDITKSKVTGITISDEQEKFAQLNYNPDKVVIINMDYRNILETYDYIYSIGMFEHVRYENYDNFFSIIKKSLKPGGRFVLHTIISFEETNKKCRVGDNFVTTHIFPGGQIPQNDWILTKAKENGLNIVHFEGFGGQHYAKTLKTWRENMWKEKENILTKYPLELMLKYDYYFAICEAGFNTGMLGIGHYIIVSEPILSLNNSYGSI
jgi:cyclopropane-fatty-acyl-phospholipid synthase